MDESGDLGFDLTKKGTSKYFVITMLTVENKRVLDKIVKKVYQKLSPKQMQQRNGVLHCNQEDNKIRMGVYNQLVNRDIASFCLVLKKENVFNNDFKSKHLLYNNLVKYLLKSLFTKRLLSFDEKLVFYASKRETNKFLNQNFLLELNNEFSQDSISGIEFRIDEAYKENGLQLVDFISWAIFKKYEDNELYFYEIIKSKIYEERTI